ncbi:MAG: hypothetical protein SFW64_00185 [Alphaproteobacteria bacterium]|nr:hypothetical protein [Alphaproteobacteria bacterium]
MTALAAERSTVKKEGEFRVFQLAADTKIYQGALVAIDANGRAVPGSTATTLKGVGRAEETIDNIGGAAGDKSISVRRGIFQYVNSAGGDLIAAKDIGASCYMVDDQTVALTSAAGTRSVAGIIHDVDANGVWVKF